MIIDIRLLGLRSQDRSNESSFMISFRRLLVGVTQIEGDSGETGASEGVSGDSVSSFTGLSPFLESVSLSLSSTLISTVSSFSFSSASSFLISTSSTLVSSASVLSFPVVSSAASVDSGVFSVVTAAGFDVGSSAGEDGMFSEATFV